MGDGVLDEAGTESFSRVESRDDDLGVHDQGQALDGPTTGLDEVREELRLLRKAVEQHHERAAARERVIDKLNTELDRLRLGDRRSLLRPVLLELCRLRDDLLKQTGSLSATFSADQAQKLLESYADTVELALEAHAVLPFAPGPGERFDPRRHRRVSTVPTAEESRHGTIATTDRSGYTDEETDRVLQHAGVVLFEYRPHTADPVPPVATDRASGDTATPVAVQPSG
jgi:molecular chaperone GrpE